MAQLAANAAEIAALKAEKEALSRRVVKLEEELALAKLHRFAPRSEKHIDRIFNEAEEAADEDDRNDGLVIDLPDTGLPGVDSAAGRSVAADPCRKTCRASASNTIYPTIKRLALAATVKCIAWARPLPSSSYRGQSKGTAECSVQGMRRLRPIDLQFRLRAKLPAGRM